MGINYSSNKEMSLVFTRCDGSHVDNTKELYTVATLLFQGNPMDIGCHSYGNVSIDRFHMTLWRPHWCTITKKRCSCLRKKAILRELNSFFM